MHAQIDHTRDLYKRAVAWIDQLDKQGRFAVLLATRLYERHLDTIEAHHYDIFTRSARNSSFTKARVIMQTLFSSYINS